MYIHMALRHRVVQSPAEILSVSSALPARTSLHQRIRSDLEAKILSGRWAPGKRIPFEHELIATYGCARMTVNRALTELVRAGLIERRRRAGSFVARPRAQSAVLAIPDLKAEVESRGERYGYALLSRRRRLAGPRDETELGVAQGTPVLALTSLHLAAGRPLALETRLLNLPAVPEAERTNFTATPPGSWLLEHVPWTEAEHRITAAGADRVTARRLGTALGSACLVVDRRTWRSGEPITAVRQVFPGERYHLVARFAPQEG
jgi:GntR family histidine utilization transcriptional repressor